MQFHFHANQSHFHKKGFALSLALKQRHKGTQKWPIDRASVVVGQLFIFIIRLMLRVSCMFQETRIR